MTVSFTVEIKLQEIEGFVTFLDDYQEGVDYTVERVPHPDRVKVENLIRKRWGAGRPASMALAMRLDDCPQWSTDWVRIIWATHPEAQAGAVAFRLRFMDDLNFRDDAKPLATIPPRLRQMMAGGQA